jgi:hypothetical protein
MKSRYWSRAAASADDGRGEIALMVSRSGAVHTTSRALMRCVCPSGPMVSTSQRRAWPSYCSAPAAWPIINRPPCCSNLRAAASHSMPGPRRG